MQLNKEGPRMASAVLNFNQSDHLIPKAWAYLRPRA